MIISSLRTIIILFTLLIAFPLSGFQEKGRGLEKQVEQFRSMLQSSQYNSETTLLYNSILEQLRKGERISAALESDGWYYAGFYNQNDIINRPDSAILYFREAIRIREENGLSDENLSKAYINMALIFLIKEDPAISVRYLEEALEIHKALFGTGSEKTLGPLLNLSAAYIDASLSEEALEVALRGISIQQSIAYPGSLQTIKFFTNAGIASMRLGNYADSRNYFAVAYNILSSANIKDRSLMISIINGMGVSQRFLGNYEEAVRWFSIGESLYNKIDGSVSQSTLSLTSNYAFLMAEMGDTASALNNLNSVVKSASTFHGTGSPDHLRSLELLAYYHTFYGGNPEKGIEIYSGIEEFLAEIPWNSVLINTVRYGYARALSLIGKKDEALDKVNTVLNDSLLSGNKIKLITLTLKREILSDLYLLNNNIEYLMLAYNAATEAVELYDILRNDISSEESDIMMGSRYKKVYEDCILTLHRLWKATGEQQYLNAAFNYAEKAKASSLLASTRQLRAINFHLPEKVARLERRLESEVNTLSELIYNEQSRHYPDAQKVSGWEKMRLQAQISRDSLNRIIERDYPDYSDLKNNRGAAQYRDIRKTIGKHSDFIEFYVADSVLYVFLINRSNFLVKEISFTQELQSQILELRSIITNPAIEKGAREQFSRFVTLSHSLYETLLGGIDKSFTTGRLIIAPDNILSYIPFEILLNRNYVKEAMNYRNLPYLVESYDILYAYSGTLLKETVKGGRNLTNRALIFAPEYRGDIQIDSLMVTRQPGLRTLSPIKGAREEAIAISEMLGGELYLDREATESRFRQRANSMPVIHLAMHTLLNDSDPMYSKMIFDFNDDGPNDGMLNTYEVYDIPVTKSKMVVLSSCNTGSGQFKKGEGVLSLARGFFYSGSPTVVMSLWEVEDQSGSDIVKLFYSNLKRGYSKSKALRRARREYLDEAVQMRSHPYFWSTLVIMGDDSPIFFNLWNILAGISGLLVLLAGIIGFYRLKSSS